MLNLQTPNGFTVAVPENKNEDTTPRFDVNLNTKKAVQYYEDNGYVIFSNCVSLEDCKKIRDSWEKSIKPYKGTIYRQTTAKAEKNLFNKNNWIMNPVLNLQSLNPDLFSDLRNIVENKVFSNSSICDALKDKPKIVQSMYF